MKLYLDDERIAPPSWVTARWPDEIIRHLESGEVTELSLDHDLGDDERGTGYDVGRSSSHAWASAAKDYSPLSQLLSATKDGNGCAQHRAVAQRSRLTSLTALQ